MLQLPLRPYQAELLDEIDALLGKDDVNRVAAILPTGMGKTVCFAHRFRRALERGERPAVFVHRDELAQQARAKLHAVMPGARIGLVKAEHNELDADAFVISIQTAARAKRMLQLPHLGEVAVDEAHHAVAPSYVRVLQHVGAFNGLPTTGWTATLARDDGKHLGDVWQDAVDKWDILWGIDHGYLVDVKGKRVMVDGLDLASVARTRGDYAEGSLGDALDSVGAGEHIAAAYIEHAADRPGVVFTPTVATARSFAEDFIRAGVPAEVIVGSTPLDERADIYRRVIDGDTQVLVNCMVLTEGWDLPKVSCAVIARPTSNAALYVQMVGRILRPFPGKDDALVIDVVGVTSRLALASLKDLSKSKVEPAEGETLRQARERHERERGQKGTAGGTRTAEDVELFNRSRSAWLQTKAGVWFIPTGESLFFLWPQVDGNVKVGTCSKKTTKGGRWIVEDVPLDYGMAYAEQAANEAEVGVIGSIASRMAGWRRRKERPSAKQIDLAERLGIKVGADATKVEVSNALSVHFASRVLDPAVNR